MVSLPQRPPDQACRLNLPYHDQALTACSTRRPSTTSTRSIRESNSKLCSESIAAGIVWNGELSYAVAAIRRSHYNSADPVNGLPPRRDRLFTLERFSDSQPSALGRLRRHR